MIPLYLAQIYISLPKTYTTAGAPRCPSLSVSESPRGPAAPALRLLGRGLLRQQHALLPRDLTQLSPSPPGRHCRRAPARVQLLGGGLQPPGSQSLHVLGSSDETVMAKPSSPLQRGQQAREEVIYDKGDPKASFVT